MSATKYSIGQELECYWPDGPGTKGWWSCVVDGFHPQGGYNIRWLHTEINDGKLKRISRGKQHCVDEYNLRVPPEIQADDPQSKVTEQPCSVCGDPYEMGPQVESALDDKIMICDDCGVHAHRTCFGGADFVIPEGPWRCPTCQFDCQPISTQTTALKCFLCARTSTDLVSTRLSVNWETARRRWVHIVCWMATAKQVGNDVIGYRYPNKLERGVVIDVKALQDSLKRASPPRQCQLCESQSGHLLDCSHPGCDQALHASCVVQAACENWLHSSKEDVCTLKGVTCSHVFCREHSEENWARQTPEDFDRRVTELFGEPDPDSEPDSEPAHEVNPARVTTPRVRSKRLETATVRVLPQRTAPNCIPSDFDLNSPFDGAIRRGEDPELDMLEEDLQHGSLRTEVLTLVERRMQEHEEEIQQLKCKVQELQAKIDGRGKRPRKRPIPASKRPRTTR